MDRKEVEALLQEAESDRALNLGGHLAMATNDQLAALCRTQLAVWDAPVVEVTREDWLENCEHFGADLIGQRVRIVPEGE